MTAASESEEDGVEQRGDETARLPKITADVPEPPGAPEPGGRRAVDPVHGADDVDDAAVAGYPGVSALYPGDAALRGADARGERHPPRYPPPPPPVEDWRVGPQRAAAGLNRWRQRRASTSTRAPTPTPPPPRQARLTVARFDPWSVMKFSFVISLVCFVVLFVAVAVLYGALAGLGVFAAIQHALANVTSSQSSAGLNVSRWLSASTILGYTAMVGAFDVVVITALATVGSVIYNLVAHLVGGIEVTLRETE